MYVCMYALYIKVEKQKNKKVVVSTKIEIKTKINKIKAKF